MFNKVEKRCIEEQRKLLQGAVRTYEDILLHSWLLHEAYNKNELATIQYEVSLIHNYSEFINNLKIQLNVMEKLITNKEIHCNLESIYNFIEGKQDYIIFNIYKTQDNGNIINTGKSYKKTFKVNREQRKTDENYDSKNPKIYENRINNFQDLLKEIHITYPTNSTGIPRWEVTTIQIPGEPDVYYSDSTGKRK